MFITQKHHVVRKFSRNIISFRHNAVAAAILALGVAGPVRAQTFTTLDLPDLNAAPPHGGAVAFSQLSDGQFVYGNNNALYLQNSFGAAGVTAFATPPGVDPSFVTVLNDTTALLGAGGGFAPSTVYQFNPSSPASPGYAAVTTLQNFTATPASATSAYVVGANSPVSGNSSVSYVNISGTQQLLVSEAGEFSGGVTTDHAGNLYVGDDDNNSVYEFTAAQVLNAVTNNEVLAFSNGTLVHTFAQDVIGSLAVDAEGRIWAAGFGADGLYWFNPANDTNGVLTPENPGGAYTVGAFSANGSDYVSFIWQAGFDDGDQVVYGFNTVQNVPEPATWTIFAAATAGLAAWWKRRRR